MHARNLLAKAIGLYTQNISIRRYSQKYTTDTNRYYSEQSADGP